MLTLSKTQFNRAIEENSVLRAEAPQLPSERSRGKRASKVVITALVAVIGVGAGWFGGRALNGRISNSPAAAPESATPAEDQAAGVSAPTTEAQPPSKHNPAVAASPPQPTADDEQPVALEPRPREPERTEAPPKTQRVDKDGQAEAPPKTQRVDKDERAEAPPKTQRVAKDAGPESAAPEDPSKETGWQSFKKKLKDAKRTANKNQPEDPRK